MVSVACLVLRVFQTEEQLEELVEERRRSGDEHCHHHLWHLREGLEVDDVLPAGGALVDLVPRPGQVVAQVVEVPLRGAVPVDDQGPRPQVDVVQLRLGLHEPQLEVGCKMVES